MNLPRTPRRALAVVAHPDDIEFMAGGLMSRWAREGVELYYCLVTDGNAGSRDPNISPSELAAQRRDEQRAAGAVFGVRDYTFLGHVDGRVVPDIELRLKIARVIRQVRPEAVLTCDPRFYYMPFYTNHPDHRAVGEATLAAIMPFANTLLAAPELTAEWLEPHDVHHIYLATAAEPNVWMPLTEDDMQRKFAAVSEHKSQIAQFEGFAELFRGFAIETGKQATEKGFPCEFAEAYTFISLDRSEAPEAPAEV